MGSSTAMFPIAPVNYGWCFFLLISIDKVSHSNTKSCHYSSDLDIFSL